MASAQVQHQTVIDELMKELESSVVQDANVGKEQALTLGAIGNRSHQTLELKYINEYSGHFTSSGPAPELKTGTVTKFNHEGTPPKGSMVGVAYHAAGHQWVMAWMVPLQNPATKPSLNRVYVEDGPNADIDWKVIEEKLERSGDRSTSPGAIAAITHGSIAKLAVVFRDPIGPHN